MSQGLVDELSSDKGFHRLHQLCQAGGYIVIPAFEVLLDRTEQTSSLSADEQLQIGYSRAGALVHESKFGLLRVLQQGWLTPFGFWRNFTAGHGPTDFTRCRLHPCVPL